MLPIRYVNIVFAFLMSALMVFIMSGFITYLNTEFEDGFFKRWGTNLISAWPIAFSAVLLFAGKIRALALKICKVE